MIIKPCIAMGAALSLLLLALTDAFHAANGGLPRGARGTSTRGGEKKSGLSASAAGFDIGEWLRQAFNPPTSAAKRKNEG